MDRPGPADLFWTALLLERPAGSVKRIFELTRLGDAVTIR